MRIRRKKFTTENNEEHRDFLKKLTGIKGINRDFY